MKRPRMRLENRGRVLVVPVEVRIPVTRISEYVEKPIVARKIASSALSSPEQEVLDLLVAGKCNKEIAVARNIEVSTVKFHARSIYRKFGVTDRRELLAQFREKKRG